MHKKALMVKIEGGIHALFVEGIAAYGAAAEGGASACSLENTCQDHKRFVVPDRLHVVRYVSPRSKRRSYLGRGRAFVWSWRGLDGTMGSYVHTQQLVVVHDT